MQRLGAPALVDQATRQPVEQFGMAGRLGAEAEVAGRADQPGAEVVHPDPVDPDARRQRIGGVDDRPRQLQPPAPVRERLRVGPGDRGEEVAGHLVPLVRRVPPPEDARLAQLRAIDQGHRVRRGRRGLDQPAIDLALELPHRDDGVGVEEPLRC